MRLVFQFTHPGGVRLNLMRYTFFEVYGFNSRTREGCDKVIAVGRYDFQKFQFTHPGGVRPVRPYCRRFSLEFQFTHPGGVRQYGAKLRIMGRINKRNLRLEVLL